MFLDRVGAVIVKNGKPIVLMPARAFFVFGHLATEAGQLAVMGSNAREGIFCFWTVSDSVL